MFRSKILVPTAVVIAVCAVGSALTRHSHGTANVLSNIFFFALAVLLLLVAVATVGTGIRVLGANRRSSKHEA
jgi:hypothetical protein